MYVDAYVRRVVREKCLTGSTINEIYEELGRYTNFDPLTKVYEIEQLIKELNFSEYELKLHDEIVFCQQQIKARVDYLTLSCQVVDAQQKQIDLLSQIQEANQNIAKIKLVPTQ